MCHDVDSRPPAAPVTTGGVAAHGPLEITAGDGNRFPAYRALPTHPNGRSVLLLPDLRGAHPFYLLLAQRFAEAGFRTLVMDYYGRSAGTAPRGESFDGAAHMASLKPEHVETDAAAAVAALREEDEGPVLSVGFCLGGGYSWRLAAAGLGLAGAVGFYGPPRFFEDRAEEVSAPLLMLLAGEDVATTPEQFDALAGRLERAGKAYERHVYAGAPHSFFDDSFARWADACADSWHRLLGFVERHSPVAAA
ncbi:dienelactone hydrolase family protein [Streptomyces sp. DSM 44917]|uniref:Dienelactone hydrolase family protein n=1 Tax=Streptomyces boetiae TaxID=3075541 RepID=A0ABU2LA34_9ACTN|nr:dienelactone hydrolase family protein [Streptomyces sp. DSM 44917]MDT0308435.1 dienelactone hydrolase family protein [Streptomyces sp. DSM 44917]